MPASRRKRFRNSEDSTARGGGRSRGDYGEQTKEGIAENAMLFPYSTGYPRFLITSRCETFVLGEKCRGKNARFAPVKVAIVPNRVPRDFNACLTATRASYCYRTVSHNNNNNNNRLKSIARGVHEMEQFFLPRIFRRFLRCASNANNRDGFFPFAVVLRR